MSVVESSCTVYELRCNECGKSYGNRPQSACDDCLAPLEVHYDLVLIDVEGEKGVQGAEHVCSEIKTAQPEQLVAFVCNWRVANLTDCPDEIVRTEFDPAAFADGVNAIVPEPPGQ